MTLEMMAGSFGAGLACTLVLCGWMAARRCSSCRRHVPPPRKG
jgi:hypothetical protein